MRAGRGEIARCAVAIFIAVGMAGVALACRQIVGIGDAPPADPSSACGLPYGSASCGSCVAAHCCDPSSACAADPTCAAYASCLGSCDGDMACRSRCTLDHPVGRSAAFSAISACVAASCDVECGLGCGALGPVISTPDAAASCEACLATSACTDERACASSVDCDAYQRCLLTCPQYDCNEACARAHDAGSALYGPFATDFKACAADCAFGHDWRCVGHVSYPAATSPTTTIHVVAADYFSGAPVAGVSVSACASMDIACSPPAVPPVKTDPEGGATLNVPLQPSNMLSSGYSGYLLLDPPTGDGGAADYVPSLLFATFPVTEPQYDLTGHRGGNPEIANGSIPMATRDEFLNALPKLLGTTQDPSLGAVGVYVSDCLTSPAADVRISIDSPADAGLEVRYVGGGSATSAKYGAGVIFNVPPGSIMLTATPLDLGKPASRATAFVQAGAITGVEMTPTE